MPSAGVRGTIRTRDPVGSSLVFCDENFRTSRSRCRNLPHNPSSGRRNPGDEALERAVVALQMRRPGEAERLAAGVLRGEPQQPHAPRRSSARRCWRRTAPLEAIAPARAGGAAQQRPEDRDACSRRRSPPPDASNEALDQLRQDHRQGVRRFRRRFANMPVSSLKARAVRRSDRGRSKAGLAARARRRSSLQIDLATASSQPQ